jgi:hypothetical protein
MSYENPSTHTELAALLREVLKEHQRDGLSMIGNVDKLVGSLVIAIETWLDDRKIVEKKSA